MESNYLDKILDKKKEKLNLLKKKLKLRIILLLKVNEFI